MNILKAWKRAEVDARERDVADAVIAGVIIVVLLAVAAVTLTGCGNSSAPIVSWQVTINAADMTAQTRAWEICGGTVSCTYAHESPPDKEFVAGGFYGSATAGQAQCYREYGTYQDVIETEAMCE